MTPALDSFTQGYVEAALAGYGPSFNVSRLEPESLAQAVADCRRGRNLYTKFRRDDGRHFWRWRQSVGGRHGFPPLVLRLTEDGNVYFRPLANASRSEVTATVGELGPGKPSIPIPQPE